MDINYDIFCYSYDLVNEVNSRFSNYNFIYDPFNNRLCNTLWAPKKRYKYTTTKQNDRELIGSINESMSDNGSSTSIKCKNYELCKSELSIWKYNLGNSLCINCNIIYGNQRRSNNIRSNNILKLSDNIECSILLKKKKGISMTKCEHILCISCFKGRYYDKGQYKCHLCPTRQVQLKCSQV